MSAKIKNGELVVEWQAADGYVSGRRAHEVHVPLDELDGLTDDEAIRIIDDCVTEDFRERVAPSWDPDEAIAVLRRARTEG